jgi:hypothetical protein
MNVGGRHHVLPRRLGRVDGIREDCFFKNNISGH